MSLPDLATASIREQIMRALELMIEDIKESNSNHTNRNYATTVRHIARQYDSKQRPQVQFPAVFINQPGEDLKETNAMIPNSTWDMVYSLVCWIHAPHAHGEWVNAFLADVMVTIEKHQGLWLDTAGEGTLHANPDKGGSPPDGVRPLVNLHRVTRFRTSEGFLDPYEKIVIVAGLRYTHKRGNPFVCS